MSASCPGCQTQTAETRCHHCGGALRPGGYTVERVIGETAHSRVYLATAPTGPPVALKELTFSRLPSAAALKSFEAEARILRTLRHPQIPDFVDDFQEGEGIHLRLYLAQEFVEGKNLLQILEGHRYSAAEVTKIAHQLLRILIYLQSVSPPVFHRDVKPANIILRRDGKLVLVDFGAARDMGATVGATQIGTFGYMPPEQAVGIVDKSTDLYGLGSTLVQLLARRPPWEIDRDGVAKVVNTSDRFREFLLRLWQADQKRRFKNAKIALVALRRLGPRESKSVRQAAESVDSLAPAQLESHSPQSEGKPLQVTPTDEALAIINPAEVPTRQDHKRTSQYLPHFGSAGIGGLVGLMLAANGAPLGVSIGLVFTFIVVSFFIIEIVLD